MCQIPAGNYLITLKCLGYKTVVTGIGVTDSIRELTFPMTLTSIEYPEVMVYGSTGSKLEETPNDISSLSAEAMRASGA